MDTRYNKNAKLVNLSAEEGGVLYSFSIVAVLLVTIIFSIALSLLGNAEELLKKDFVIILNYLIGPIAILLAIGILRRKKGVSPIKSINFYSKSKVSLISTALIGFGLMFGLAELNTLFVTALSKFGATITAPTVPAKTFGGVLASIIFICLIPSVVEEILFRGLVFNGLKHTGTGFAIILSGVLFSIFHMSPAQTAYQFVVGCIYALVILYSKNLLYCIAMHFVNNLYLILNYYYFGIKLSGVAFYIVTPIALVSLVLGIVYLVVKGDKPEDNTVNKGELRLKFLLGSAIGIVVAIVMWIAGLVA
ncbi:MAG: CPBP family intramembrane metalloprotease [Clostridia bacterium]|nr:CPBP family intramembrane metalloprotease [Clostridia bacterium]